MGRKKLHEDDEVLSLLDDYWKKECRMVPRSLSYPGFASYLNEHGIDYDSNVLKHRGAVVEAFRKLKSGSGVSVPTKEGVEKTTDCKELQKKYRDLLKLVSDTFTESACASLLRERGLSIPEIPVLRPEAEGGAIIKINERPFENDFVRKMAAFANLDKEEEEQNNGKD